MTRFYVQKYVRDVMPVVPSSTVGVKCIRCVTAKVLESYLEKLKLASQPKLSLEY